MLLASSPVKASIFPSILVLAAGSRREQIAIVVPARSTNGKVAHRSQPSQKALILTSESIVLSTPSSYIHKEEIHRTPSRYAQSSQPYTQKKSYSLPSNFRMLSLSFSLSTACSSVVFGLFLTCTLLSLPVSSPSTGRGALCLRRLSV